MKPAKDSVNLKVKIEQISFESHGTYMDVESHDGYVDVTIGGIENEKFSITIDEWQIINKKILELLKQK